MRHGLLAFAAAIVFASAPSIPSWAGGEESAGNGFRVPTMADARAAVLSATRGRQSFVFRHDGNQQAWGSGVLVSRSKNGREGLVLTVAHNLPDGLANPHLKLDGKRVNVKGVVAKNVQWDYALVKVELPRASIRERVGNLFRRLTGRGTTPTKLPEAAKIARLGEMAPGEQTYIHGYPSEGVQRPAAAVHFGNDLAPGIGRIGTGPESPSVPSKAMSYSSGIGFSGAPVYSARSGKVVAVHHANDFKQGQEISYSVPTEVILKDLANKLAHNKVNGRYQRELTGLLRASGVDNATMKQWGAMKQWELPQPQGWTMGAQ